MSNHERLTKALQFVAPELASGLDRAGRAARDARRDRDAGGLDDPRVPEGLAARLRAEGREDPNQAVRKAALRAKRAAKATARELQDAPSTEDIAKMEAYHKERMAQPEAALPAAETPKEEVPFEELDIRALSLARRARNESLQKAAAAEEAQAKADWVKRTGGKRQLGTGFKGHGREEAYRDAPMPDDPEADAAALREFRRNMEDDQRAFLASVEAYDPLAGYVSKRDVRKDARAARAAEGGSDAAHSDSSNRETRQSRDKPDCRPANTRGRR